MELSSQKTENRIVHEKYQAWPGVFEGLEKPFKQGRQRVGYERMQDMADPARSLDRSREYGQHHGRSEKWIQQQMMGQETRNKLTDYWKEHEIKEGEEFAILTNIIHQEWSWRNGKRSQEHQKLEYSEHA